MLAKNIFHVIDDGFVISDNTNMNKLNDFSNIENQVKDTVRLSNEIYKIHELISTEPIKMENLKLFINLKFCVKLKD